MFGSGASPQLAEGKFHSSTGRISLPKGNFTLAKQEFHFEVKDLDKLRFGETTKGRQTPSFLLL